MTKYSLVRTALKDTDKPENVVLIGNGAIENGWGPFTRVLPPFFGLADAPSELLLGWIAKWEENLRYLYLETLFDSKLVAKQRGLKLREIRSKLQEFCVYRENLCREFARSTDLRRRQWPKLLRDIAYSPSTAFITTNWDETLWGDTSLTNLVQLHGRVSDWRTLILPTEIATQERLFSVLSQISPLHGSGKARAEKAFSHRFGRASAYALQKEAHRQAIEWLENAKNIFVWGLAFHTYDIELASVIVHSRSPKLECKISINGDHPISLTGATRFPYRGPLCRSPIRIAFAHAGIKASLEKPRRFAALTPAPLRLIRWV